MRDRRQWPWEGLSLEEIEDLDLPDWRQDDKLLELDSRLRAAEVESGRLTGALDDAEAQVEHTATVAQQIEALFYAGAESAEARDQAQETERKARERWQQVRGEQLLNQRAIQSLRQARALAERSAKERCAAELRRHYREAAEALAELMPRMVQLQSVLQAIHAQARQCFPYQLQGARTETRRPAEPVPAHAGLPELFDRHWVPRTAPSAIAPRPRGYHGGRVGKLRRELDRYLEVSEGSVAVAE